MAALYPAPLANEGPANVPALESLINDTDLNTTFGDVARLVENLRASLDGGDSKWLIKDGAPFETWAILAGAGKVLPWISFEARPTGPPT